MRIFILSFLILLALPATAGDSPDIPFHDLKAYIPQLLAGAEALSELHKTHCEGAEAVDAKGLMDSDALSHLSSMRVATKELKGSLSWFIGYEEDLPHFEGGQEMIDALPDAKRLEEAKALKEMGKKVKKARSRVKRLKSDTPESAQEACEAIEALVRDVQRVDFGVFASPPAEAILPPYQPSFGLTSPEGSVE